MILCSIVGGVEIYNYIPSSIDYEIYYRRSFIMSNTWSCPENYKFCVMSSGVNVFERSTVNYLNNCSRTQAVKYVNASSDLKFSVQVPFAIRTVDYVAGIDSNVPRWT